MKNLKDRNNNTTVMTWIIDFIDTVNLMFDE